MLEKALKLIVTLTLLFFLLQAVVGLLMRLIEATLRPVATAVAALGGLLTGLIAAAALLCLTVGLLVRAKHFVISRNPRVARERAVRERAVHTRVRRPAEDVPVHEPQAPDPDPDPAINDAENG